MNYKKELFENQKIILLALNKLLTPHCKGSLRDANGETQCNINLIERYHITEKILKILTVECKFLSVEKEE
ncbi:hypothetical protein JYQ78_00180 [Anaerobutyricum hallii]|uniref:hypothetical protein n=1 Tax=Anaerobutyricum hallii TaxID=39488 RepID=UPI001ADDBF88|nr:hypothetical protein [Anaerobutyricum hallii]MBP0061694.1 hypothetical protein [Anaerobutyricum hallii]